MTQQRILRGFGWALLAFCAAFANAAFAAANVQSMYGDARAGSQQLRVGDRITTGATITTGRGSLIVLRFDDSQVVVLNENTTFRITDFRYRKEEPRNDRSIFDLVRGALRVISGAVASRNQNAFQLRAPQATIGIRGTDFMVAIVNPAITSVGTGAISVTNSGGTTVFGAGSFGSVASASSLAVSIPASAVPAAASAAFGNMSALAGVVAGGMAPGAAGVGAGAATVGIVPAAIVIGGVVAVGAALKDDNDAATTHHAP